MCPSMDWRARRLFSSFRLFLSALRGYTYRALWICFAHYCDSSHGSICPFPCFSVLYLMHLKEGTKALDDTNVTLPFFEFSFLLFWRPCLTLFESRKS